MASDRKQELIRTYGTGENDTGSSQVQVALLTERVNHLTGHLQTNVKDHAGRRSLLMMVARRNKLLKYLRRTDAAGYQKLIGVLGLRK